MLRVMIAEVESGVLTGTGFDAVDAMRTDLTYEASHMQSATASVTVDAVGEGQATACLLLRKADVTFPSATFGGNGTLNVAYMSKTFNAGSTQNSFGIDFDQGPTSVINVAAGRVYELPCLPSSSFQIPDLNLNTSYNNNISEKGAFLGRTVVSKSKSVDLQPLSFVASTERMDEINEMLNRMRAKAVYVHYKVGDEDFVHYGWTDSDPQVEYTGDGLHMRVSFTLRCPA